MTNTQKQAVLKRINDLPADRASFACFDLDHTLARNDVAESIFCQAIEEGLLSQASLPSVCRVLKFKSRNEDLFTYYHRMQRIGYSYSAVWLMKTFAGQSVETLIRLTQTVMRRTRPYRVGPHRLRPPRPNTDVFQMLLHLQKRGITPYVVSASFHISVVTFCREFFDLPAERVFGIATWTVDSKEKRHNPYGLSLHKIRTDVLTSQIIRPFPSEESKIAVIRKHISRTRRPIFCISDSPVDLPLLRYCSPNGISIWLKVNQTPATQRFQKLIERHPLSILCLRQ